MGTSETIIKVIKVCTGLVEVLLGLNVLLKLLGALPTFILFQWIYDFSAPFKSPFDGTLAPIAFGERFILDLSAIFAMIAYLLLAGIFIYIVKYAFKSSERK